MANKTYTPTPEQQKVLSNKADFAVVSASAGTGKTATIINYIANMIESGEKVGKMLIVTFTNNAANEMKERLLENLMSKKCSAYMLSQIDDVLVADICTIHSYLQKLIKRNIDKFTFSENFVLADEQKAREIRERAYKNAYSAICKIPSFESLISSTRKEQDLLFNIVNAVESHFSVQADPKERLEYYKANQSKIFEQSEKVLNDNLIEKFYKFHIDISKILDVESHQNKNFCYLQNFKDQVSKVLSENSFKENVEAVSLMNFKRAASVNDLTQEFLLLKQKVFDEVKECKKWDLNQEEEWIENPLILDVYKFYEIYIENLNSIKNQENILDFNDLEKYALKVLDDEKVKSEIQSDFDFVFVDEYQDTNPVQEKIVKILSKNSKFMVVGDPKQGIYGFRNATSEIMKKDISSAKKQNGEVYYLKSNFRSDPKILDFVNDVFKNVMFEKNTGISYKETSMLDGKAAYLPSDMPSVRIDALMPKEEEEKINSKPNMYEIFEDELQTNTDHLFEAEVIARRVNELVTKQAYDPQTNSFKNINYKDITILVRGKGELVDKITDVFSKYKIPLVSTIERNLFENEEIDVLRNFLKVCVDKNDDVSLASVLCSKLFDFSLEKIYNIRKTSLEKSFYECFVESEESKIFFEELEKFKTISLAKGIKFAFEKLFSNTDYYAYLLSKKDGLNQKLQIERFLNIISTSSHNFDIPGLLSSLEAANLKTNLVDSGANAVSLTTIHSSKGLEYKVVILAGMGGEILRRNSNSKFAVSNEFGLSMGYLDFEKDLRCKNIVLSATNLLKKKREFVDEIMLLYVAMTRAKNHLYIIGDFDGKFLSFNDPEDVFDAKTYMDIILNGFQKSSAVEFNIIDQVDSVQQISQKKIYQKNEKYFSIISNYLNYDYGYADSTLLQYKNSVSALNENKENKDFVGGSENLDIGNAYHKALELLDFEKINRVDDIKSNLNSNFENLELLDFDLLLKNIKLIKEKVRGLKVFKERQFTMKINASEIDKKNPDETVMVQGIVDLFAIGEKNILIDYKYTNILDDNLLKNKYLKQLYLYQKAIEKAYKLKINEIYLLSLKYGKIIKIN